MAKKNLCYVLVFTDKGPTYVTGTGDHHMAYFDKGKAPMSMAEEMAENMVIGLCVNGFNAVCIKSKFELEQPYNYADYDVKFVRRKGSVVDWQETA